MMSFNSIRLGLRPWRTAPMTQAVSSLAVGFLMLLMGILVWLEDGIKTVVHRLSTENVITAYLESTLPAEKEGQVIDAIKSVVGSQAAQVEFVDQARFLDEIKTPYPGLYRELETLGNDARMVTPKYVSAVGRFSKSTLTQVQSLSGVEFAESSENRHTQIVGAFKTLRTVLRFLILGITLVLLGGLVQLVRLNSHLHQDVLSMMKLWGAKQLSLKAPMIVSGAIVGFWGGAVAAVTWLFVGTWVGVELRSLTPMLGDLPAAHPGLSVALWAAALALGTLSGLFATDVEKASR